ncbi:MAG TPA: hypothetical protein VKQ29_10685 [Aliidongia sp.]|nr:hypothetical protein [Aliidongia sp.]
MMTGEKTTSATVEPALFSAADIHDMVDRKKREEAAAAQQRHQAAEEEKKHQEEMFLARKLTPEFINTVMRRVRNAAESGANEIMVGQFPSDWCTDGGRAINAPEDSWPDTLQGIAREFFEFWQRDLRPRGFHLHVKIINFPGGMPGDVGAFLSW